MVYYHQYKLACSKLKLLSVVLKLNTKIRFLESIEEISSLGKLHLLILVHYRKIIKLWFKATNGDNMNTILSLISHLCTRHNHQKTRL